MKILRNFIFISLIIIIISSVLGHSSPMAANTSTQPPSKLPIKVALFSRDLNDDYLVFLRENFEDIQRKNEGKVEFSFYNSNFNQSTQNSDITDKLDEGVDLILLDMVDVYQVSELINKISQFSVPVILFNREPFSLDAIKSYKKSLFIGTDSKQAGIIQGKMIVDAWNNHKDSIDKNKDNVLQYILLNGEVNDKAAIDRTKYSISTIQQAGIKTDELSSGNLHWSTELARDTVSSLFLKYDGRIEAIISNDDSMAVGAIEALQKYGYNSGNKSKLIPVVGVDGTPEAIDLISKGFMLGSALADPADMANVIYTIGLNLVYDRNPLERTPYNFNETGVVVYLPFKEYTGPMFN